MQSTAFKQAKTACLVLVFFSIITGLIYPLLVTGLSQLFFPWQANGSIIKKNNLAIGSALIGQSFDSLNYFWGRPSATTPFPYNAASSSGSNMGPSNLEFLGTVKNRIDTFKKADLGNKAFIPVDLVTASASGLDPDISPLAAYYQTARIAKQRHISAEKLRTLIQNNIIERPFLLLGEPRVNVLQLNIALDNLK